jgi:membrane-associated phospholipid phosphatase
VLPCIVLCMLGGCTTQSGYTIKPGYDRIKSAARKAAVSKHTWVPLLGAVLFSIEDFDEQTSDWATDHNPLFGDFENAKDWSDGLAVAADVNWLVTATIAPPGSEPGYRRNRLVMQGLAFAVNIRVTDGLKTAFDRTRPDGRNHGFPSLHTSSSTVGSTLAAQNIEALNLSESTRKIWTLSSYGLSGLVGWARVEGKRHYPSDVLFGYALGHFIANFMNNAFVAPEDQVTLAFSAGPVGDNGFKLTVNMDL